MSCRNHSSALLLRTDEPRPCAVDPAHRQ